MDILDKCALSRCGERYERRGRRWSDHVGWCVVRVRTSSSRLRRRAITAQTIERSAQNLYKLVVSVPHRSFNSGEPTRDKDVESLLGGEKHPNIQLETEELSKEKVRRSTN